LERGGRDIAPLTQGAVASMLDNSARTANHWVVLKESELKNTERISLAGPFGI